MKPNFSLDQSLSKIIKLPRQNNVSDINVNKLALTIGNTIQLVELDQISHFQSDNNYTHIRLLSGKVFLSSKTMKRFEEHIDSVQFLRVHKSYIINTKHISSFNFSENFLELKDGSCIPVSRSKKSLLIHYLKKLMV